LSLSIIHDRALQIISKITARDNRSAGLSDEHLGALLRDVEQMVGRIRILAQELDLRVIGLTSVGPQEGTSTLVSSLGLVLSRRSPIDPVVADAGTDRPSGVLLIDAQFRQPALHQLFSLDGSPGLAEFFAGYSAGWKDIVAENLAPGLSLLPAGAPENMEKFPYFDLKRWTALLGELKEQYEFVLMDMPPLLHYPESVQLGKLCDGVALVTCYGQTKREAVQAARRSLEYANIRFMGAILNRRMFYIPESLYHRL
jgi:Mrp family chromosome partitioning ATPase